MPSWTPCKPHVSLILDTQHEHVRSELAVDFRGRRAVDMGSLGLEDAMVEVSPAGTLPSSGTQVSRLVDSAGIKVCWL